CISQGLLRFTPARAKPASKKPASKPIAKETARVHVLAFGQATQLASKDRRQSRSLTGQCRMVAGASQKPPPSSALLVQRPPACRKRSGSRKGQAAPAKGKVRRRSADAGIPFPSY